MSTVVQMYETGAVVLGYVGAVASWRRISAEYQAQCKSRMPASEMLCITTSASTDEGAHEPAQSITIASRAALLALRSAIDEALKMGAAA